MKLLVINVLVGAVIGLFTNWLAIVMLFRPWTEKKVFGKRLPFTPGLIPSRQSDLAEKLGEIVEHDLLTPEGVAKSLGRPALEFAVKRSVIQAVSKTLNEAPTLGMLSRRMFGDTAQERIETVLVQQIISFLQQGEGRARVASMADALFDHLRETLSDGEVRRNLVAGFADPLHAQLTAGTTTWQQVLPESARDLVEDRLRAQVEPLLDGLARWMEEPVFVDAIARMLTEKVESIPLIGSMAKSFLTPERVSSDIVPRLQSVVQSASVQELAQDKLHHMLSSFWEQPVGRYLGKLSTADFNSLLEKILETLLDQALDENAATRSQFRSLVVNGLLAGASEHTIGDLLRRVLGGVMEFDVRNLYVQHTETVDRLIGQLWHYLRDQMIDALPELLEALSVRQIVQEQVESYPIPTLEKLVLSVVNKEVKMITYLGGILGALIGLIQALVSRL
ncbi:DUF445 family protein [Tumebacillus permanentifrigoris]|uniref:Uncharacterized membrane protein YheB (UPF0754 family) n=1 Tax=Tumebacillus permanentifrigoris TaxID=378543 RepID=A0A316D9K6_9BACL|nr:DUF445 family protein [Tumebacillus permanentifrigoris]PWK13858.1 uncharacterized membrane protein YheB (UPF0754 family) [Tumebacillus permanentifrigoris]